MNVDVAAVVQGFFQMLNDIGPGWIAVLISIVSLVASVLIAKAADRRSEKALELSEKTAKRQIDSSVAYFRFEAKDVKLLADTEDGGAFLRFDASLVNVNNVAESVANPVLVQGYVSSDGEGSAEKVSPSGIRLFLVESQELPNSSNVMNLQKFFGGEKRQLFVQIEVGSVLRKSDSFGLRVDIGLLFQTVDGAIYQESIPLTLAYGIDETCLMKTGLVAYRWSLSGNGSPSIAEVERNALGAVLESWDCHPQDAGYFEGLFA